MFLSQFLNLIVLKINPWKKVVYCVLCLEWPRKEKHNEMTFKTKYEILRKLGKDRPNKEVAIQFKVPGSTVATWKRNQEKIYQAFQNPSLKRRRVKVGTCKKISGALSKWFTSMRGNNVPINGPILLEKEIKARRGGEAMETLNRLSLLTLNSGFDPLISKLTRIINQGRRDKMP